MLAARAMGGKVPVIDMNDLICSPTWCASIVGNVLVYRDTHHVTSTYTGTLAAFLEQRLIKADKIFSRT